MKERAYTVSEIDRMRDAVGHRLIFGVPPSSPDIPLTFPNYKEVDKTVIVEEQLRTYMIAGIEPEELE